MVGFILKKIKKNEINNRLKLLFKRIRFIESAEHFLHMRMGELNSVLWNSRFFIPALEKLIGKGVKVEIVIEKIDVMWNQRKCSCLRLEGKIDVYVVR